MKQLLTLTLIITIGVFTLTGITFTANANEDGAVVGKIFLRPGMSKNSLTGSTASIFAGNSLTMPGNKTIKVYGADDQFNCMATSDDYNLSLYGFDTSQNKVGTYAFSICHPFDSNHADASSGNLTLTMTKSSFMVPDPSILAISDFSQSRAGISFRPNYAGGVRFGSLVDFFNSGATRRDGAYSITQYTATLVMGTNDLAMLTGKFTMSVGGGMAVNGRFVLDYAETDSYNDFN